MRLGDTAFLNLFAQLVPATTRNRGVNDWTIDGVYWTRTRHNYGGSGISFQIDVHRLRREGVQNGWELFVIHEIWWTGERSRALRNWRWVHLASGSRRDALAWFKRRETTLGDIG